MSRKEISDYLIEILSIPSNTFKEKTLSQFLKGKLAKQFSKHDYQTLSFGDSFICTPKKKSHPSNSSSKPHIALVGHLDVVPEFVKPWFSKHRSRRIYGAGASDMQSSLAVFVYLFNHLFEAITAHCQLSLIFYAKEEGTSLENNGLYELIQKYPAWFKTLDLAIVGEPTVNHIQVGCVGSIHAHIQFKGKACHSARPWEGVNALYQAAPFINNMSRLRPQSYRIFGLDFKEVFQITESESSKGITTLPEKWEANLNYRFAPRFNKQQALTYFKQFLEKQGLTPSQYHINSFSPAGLVIENSFSKRVFALLKKQGCLIKPKQAWTDVAQFGTLGIPAFNFGPGLPEKCHTADEYVIEKDVLKYAQILEKFFSELMELKG